jgi:hypothetical protein
MFGGRRAPPGVLYAHFQIGIADHLERLEVAGDVAHSFQNLPQDRLGITPDEDGVVALVDRDVDGAVVDPDQREVLPVEVTTDEAGVAVRFFDGEYCLAGLLIDLFCLRHEGSSLLCRWLVQVLPAIRAERPV